MLVAMEVDMEATDTVKRSSSTAVTVSGRYSRSVRVQLLLGGAAVLGKSCGGACGVVNSIFSAQQCCLLSL